MSGKACGLCGRDPAAGYATIDGVFYCHGDEDPEPTCYMRSQSKYVQGTKPVGFPSGGIVTVSRPAEGTK